MADQNSDAEAIQRLTIALIARESAGSGLVLIGGFRLRMVDRSARRSADLDFHCADDLEQRQSRLVQLFRSKLLNQVKSRLGYDGSAQPASGPAAEGPFVKTIDLAFWKTNVPFSRLEIPVDLLRIPCADRPVARTIEGSVCLVTSDADMIESKVLALFRRTPTAARDFVDLFLFSDRLLNNSASRLATKLPQINLTTALVQEKLNGFRANREMHVRAVARVIEDQVERPTAANIQSAGGAAMIFDQGISLLASLFDSDVAS